MRLMWIALSLSPSLFLLADLFASSLLKIEAEEDDKGHSEQDREVAAMDKHY